MDGKLYICNRAKDKKFCHNDECIHARPHFWRKECLNDCRSFSGVTTPVECVGISKELELKELRYKLGCCKDKVVELQKDLEFYSNRIKAITERIKEISK